MTRFIFGLPSAELIRLVPVSTWDDEVASRAVTYLAGRGFRDAAVVRRVDGPVVLGKRGTLLGKYVGFDMKRLNAKVRVALFSPGLLIARMDVDTSGRRWLTEWNRATWRLELAELCAVLNGAPMSSERWQRFDRDARRAAILGVFSARAGGEPLSAAWREEIEALEQEYSGRV